MAIDPVGSNNIYSVQQMGTPVPYNQLGVQGINTQPIAIPDGIILRKKIAKEYGIEVVDSDAKFSGAEIAIIADTLEDIKKKKRQHLMGVRQIIKNREQRIKLLNELRIDAGGAYEADSKRVYIFDNAKPEDIPEILVHEVGHAVSHFNLKFKEFMEFVKGSGYNMVEFRKFFVPGNKLHQIGLKKIEIDKNRWDDVLDRFSMKTLAKNQDIFGEMILELKRSKKHPWDENPLEAFAWAYEWYFNKNPEFQKRAYKLAERGDSTLLNDYDFMEHSVFTGGNA